MKTKLVLSLVACASFAVGPINAQTIEVTSTGVGIGTSAPTRNLDITGNQFAGIDVHDSVGNLGQLTWHTADGFRLTTISAKPLVFFTNDNERLRIDSSGNVGIGTTAPNWKMHILDDLLPGVATTRYPLGIGNTGTPSALVMGFSKNSANTLLDAQINVIPNIPLTFYTNNIERMTLAAGGNVGIGTATPLAPLQVGNGTDASSMTGVAGFIRATSHLYSTGITARRDGYAEVGMRAGSVGEIGTFTSHDLLLITNAAERMRIDTVGNVGIGTTSPSYKLHVAGSVRATSFVADVNTYADFVFKPGYKLASLADVESSIQANGHLPDIPSEAEVKRDGMDVVQMQTKLLQKVEELTLHLIAHEKTLSSQQQELRRLAEENASLRRTLSSLNAQ